MDYLKTLITLIIISISSSVYSQSSAGTEIANIQSWLNEGSQGFYKPGTGDQWVRNQAGGDRYVKVTSGFDYTARNGKSYPVVVEKTARIDASKIGKAVASMAKFIGPLALGIQVAGLICDLSEICQKTGTDEWEVPITTGLAGLEQQILSLSGWVRNGVTFNKALQQILSDRGCGGSFDCVIADVYINGTQVVATYDLIRKSDGANVGQDIYNKISDGYTMPEPEKQAPTEQQWTNAEIQLNDPRFDEPLLVNGRPVPLANLPILGNTPSITLDETETINRDGNGNVTGTTTTKTELHISDGATTERPGSVTGTETTTKTDFDTGGQQTGTQTTNSNPPPPEKPTETKIEFDTVPDDVPVPTKEIPISYNSTSWGAGFCPDDQSITLSAGHTLTFDTQPACDVASNLRPFVLVIASLFSAFIVLGVKV